MLYEIAIADAYGAAFEFAKPEFIKANNNLRYLRHPSRDHENILVGQYTDDTQMSMAVAELMMQAHSDLVVTQVDFAAKFVKVFQRDKRKGYSKRVQNALESVYEYYDKPLMAGAEFMYYLGSSSSTANGCVMRTLPLGLLKDKALIERYCILHASVTHTSKEAIDATILVSMAAHALYHNLCTHKNLGEWLTDNCGREIWMFPVDKPVPCRAMPTAEAAIRLVMKNDNLASILSKAIALGGDTDSTAAVAVGLGSLCSSIKKNLPLSLKRGLENSQFGNHYLKDLDKKMFKLFPRMKKPI